MWITSFSRIKIVNASSSAIAEFTISDPSGQEWVVGDIAAGQTRRQWINAEGEGTIDFAAKVGNTPVAGTAYGYFTDTGPLASEDSTIIFQPDGTVVVQEGR